MCRQRPNWETMTPEQKNAMRTINKLGTLMLTAWDPEYLFDLYCEAEDLWNEFFPFEASQWGDNWWLTKRFNDLNREIGNRQKYLAGGVNVNLFGCEVTINI